MTDALRNEALEKLSQGIEESRQLAQQQTMKLAQDYFDDSVEELRQQVRERRARLETLPDQVPGGREEGFQARFEQLMERYSKLEECLSEARSDGDFSEVEPAAAESASAGSTNVKATNAEATNAEATKSGSATGTAESVKKEEEVEATDAARREAKELGVDLTQVKGTGSGGRIVIWDVTEFVNKKEAIDEEGGQGQAGQAAQGAQEAAGRAADQAGQTADGAGQGMQDAAGGVLGQVGQVTEQAQEAAEDVSGDSS